MSGAEGLRAAMQRAGLDSTGLIVADGKLHRFKASGDRERNSWYVLHVGPPTAGAFGCWKRDIKEVWCESNRQRSEAEWREVRHRWQDADYEQERRQSKAREVAVWILGRSTKGIAHGYLAQKGVKAWGDVRHYRGALVVPLRDVNGELQSLQFIGTDGAKRFLSGGRIAGCFFALQAHATESKGVSVPLIITQLMEAALRARGQSQERISKMTPAEAHAVLFTRPDDANKSDGPLVLCEGYATGASVHEAAGLAVVCVMHCANLLSVAQALRTKWPTREIVIAADNDAWTEGNPGLAKATEAAQAIHAKLAVPKLGDGGTKPTDFNDLHRLVGLEEVKRQIEAATEPREEAYSRLAKLTRADYEQCRKFEAKQLRVRVGALDAEVDARRAKKVDCGPKSATVQFPDLKPWEDPVDGVELLNALAVKCDSFIWLPPHGATVLPLITLYSYCWRCFEYAPILAVTSPTPSCGKGRVLEVLQKHLFNPWRTGNATEAVLFRIIDERSPHVLIDEFDSLGEDTRKAIANILNQAFHVSGRVHRVEGERERRVVEFKCFAPMVVACVKLSTFGRATVTRCIHLRMQRKPRKHKLERLRKYDGTEFRRKCLRWFNDNKERIETAVVQMPDELDDRTQDIWEPLFVIAHVVGGVWLERVRQAALALCGEDMSAEVEDTGVHLLRWCRTHFEETGSDRVRSQDLCEWLNVRPEAGFGSWREGKGIDQRTLARLLRPFGIGPRNIADDDQRPKGYLREGFVAAWESYCPSDAGDTNRYSATDPENKGENAVFGSATDAESSGSQNPQNLNKDGAGSGVADEKPGEARETGKAGEPGRRPDAEYV